MADRTGMAGLPCDREKVCGAIKLPSSCSDEKVVRRGSRGPRIAVVEAAHSGKCNDFANVRRFGSARDRRTRSSPWAPEARRPRGPSPSEASFGAPTRSTCGSLAEKASRSARSTGKSSRAAQASAASSPRRASATSQAVRRLSKSMKTSGIRPVHRPRPPVRERR
jgi:hypothetical protein